MDQRHHCHTHRTLRYSASTSFFGTPWRRSSYRRAQTSDRFIEKWTVSGTYTASSAYSYRAFFIGMTSLLGAKFFFSLGHHGRLWTADRRRRHGLQPEAKCALCDQDDETTDHLAWPLAHSRAIEVDLGTPALAKAEGTSILHRATTPCSSIDWWLLTYIALQSWKP